MSKVLTVFIVVLASFLLYDMFGSSNDDSNELKEVESPQFSVKTTSKANINKESEKAVPLYEIESGTPPKTTKFEAQFIEAAYAATIDNERIKAKLNFTFSEDGRFVDDRDMTFPKSIAGEATGTYTIDGAFITLVYAEKRDKEVFKFDNSKMSLHEDGTLRTGTVVLTKQ